MLEHLPWPNGVFKAAICHIHKQDQTASQADWVVSTGNPSLRT